ncbi:MAG: hypothetical protein WC030_02515 [Candidatus Paceibacterota bacterium]
MRNTEKTFRWLVDTLRTKRIPFVVSGGLAAQSYGSLRVLNDIDIEVHDHDIETVAKDVERYITYGPARYRDDRWDCVLLKLNHEGQEVDVCGGDTLKICDARTGEWVDSHTEFDKTEARTLFGVPVPVITRQELIEYKAMLVGEHQQVDIRAVSAAQNLA